MAVRGFIALSSSAIFSTVIIFTPIFLIAWSYALRALRGMITSVFSNPERSGIRISFSGLPPVTQAAVTCFKPAAHPADTIPHSALVNSASRLPIPSASSSYCTKFDDAASIAARTCGRSREPPIIVKVPRQLISGSTPIDSKIFPFANGIPPPATFAALSAPRDTMGMAPPSGSMVNPFRTSLRFMFRFCLR